MQESFIVCPKCEGNSCHEVSNDKLTVWSCFGCGFTSNSTLIEDKLEEVKGGFGSDIDLGNGLILNVTDPEVFKAKDFAALGVDGRPLIINIKISNTGSKDVDLASFSIIQSKNQKLKINIFFSSIFLFQLQNPLTNIFSCS